MELVEEIYEFGDYEGYVGWGILILVLLYVLYMFVVSPVVVPEGSVALKQRFGRYTATLSPGLHFLFCPMFVDKLKKVRWEWMQEDEEGVMRKSRLSGWFIPLARIDVDPEAIKTWTKDRTEVTMNVQYTLKVSDVRRAVYGIQQSNPIKAVIKAGKTTIDQLCREYIATELTADPKHFASVIHEKMQTHCAQVGVEMVEIVIQNVDVAADVIRADRQSSIEARQLENQRMKVLKEHEAEKERIQLEHKVFIKKQNLAARRKLKEMKMDAKVKQEALALEHEQTMLQIKAEEREAEARGKVRLQQAELEGKIKSLESMAQAEANLVTLERASQAQMPGPILEKLVDVERVRCLANGTAPIMLPSYYHTPLPSPQGDLP